MKYTQGYIPKIQYWVNKLLSAATTMEQVKALNKINYFKNRHYEVYGEWVSVDDLSYGVEPE